MRAIGRLLASLLVALRHVFLLALIAGTAWIGLSLPSIPSDGNVSLFSLVPEHSTAARAQRISATQFAFPVSTTTTIVVRDRSGLSASRQLALTRLAVSLTRGEVRGFRAVAGAVPVLNALAPESVVRERGTTALLYLYFRPSVDSFTQMHLAQQLARHEIGHGRGEYVGVTGVSPALAQQGDLIEEWLAWVQLATILLVALAVGIHFRAIGAALATIGTVIAAYVIADRVVELVSKASSIEVPGVIGPVLVVLVFGVATDYSIFFISRFRSLLGDGHDEREAAKLTIRQIFPIVFFAGLTVAAGTGSLAVANLEFLRGFGPGLAIAVAIAMLVSAIAMPTLLAIGGRRMLWPARAIAQPQVRRGDETPNGRGNETPNGKLAALSPSRFAARHPLPAVLIAASIVAGSATGVGSITLANDVIDGLPASAEAHRAYNEASEGFLPGMLAPTIVLVTAHDLNAQRAALSRLELELARQGDVAEVVGPRWQPFTHGYGFVISSSGKAARYILSLASNPFGSHAIESARAIQSRLPTLARRAGLHDAQAIMGGQSALSAEVMEGTLEDLAIVAPVMLAAIFAVIALFLRALVAPAYLVLTSVLAVLASFGLSAYVIQGSLGHEALTYYVIFITAVLLVSLGSDYNVFMVGRIWQEGRRRPMQSAVEVAATRAARPISTAGLVLALAFALIALVPVDAFREIAFAMAVGLLLDAFVIRTILVPALLTLVGPRSGWPGKALKDRSVPRRERRQPLGGQTSGARAPDRAP